MFLFLTRLKAHIRIQFLFEELLIYSNKVIEGLPLDYRTVAKYVPAGQRFFPFFFSIAKTKKGYRFVWNVRYESMFAITCENSWYMYKLRLLTILNEFLDILIHVRIDFLAKDPENITLEIERNVHIFYKKAAQRIFKREARLYTSPIVY